MWDGMIYKATSAAKSFSHHFDVVKIVEGPVFVEVYVVFDKNPEKEYQFDIPADKFKADKDFIAEEILSQIKA